MYGKRTAVAEGVVNFVSGSDAILAATVISWILIPLAHLLFAFNSDGTDVCADVFAFLFELVVFLTLFALSLYILYASYNPKLANPDAWAAMFPSCKVFVSAYKGFVGILIYQVVSFGLYIFFLIAFEIFHQCCCARSSSGMLLVPNVDAVSPIHTSSSSEDTAEKASSLPPAGSVLCFKSHTMTPCPEGTLPPTYSCKDPPVISVTCNVCSKVPLQAEPYYFHCADCSFDLCPTCCHRMSSAAEATIATESTSSFTNMSVDPPEWRTSSAFGSGHWRRENVIIPVAKSFKSLHARVGRTIGSFKKSSDNTIDNKGEGGVEDGIMSPLHDANKSSSTATPPHLQLQQQRKNHQGEDDAIITNPLHEETAACDEQGKLASLA